MSRYLRFVLDRFGAPTQRLERIVILCHQQDWANQHLLDEFRFQFPNSSVNLTQNVDLNNVDLIILPYMHNFFNELPGGKKMYACLRKVDSPWIMLYGLDYRKIMVMPAKHLSGYYRRGRLLNRIAKIVLLTHLDCFVRRIRRFRELR